LADIPKKGNSGKGEIFHSFKIKEEILSYILTKNADDFIAALNSCIRDN